MISREQALAFADEWIDAWNAHDLDTILEHYTDDFEMSSPFIVLMNENATGTLKGKSNVGHYWKNAFEKVPDLHFKLIEVLSCVNSIVIYYHSINNKTAAELFIFNEDGKVYQSMGHYN